MDGPSFISLVEFDFIDKIFRRIRTFKLTDFLSTRIFVDEVDPSKFTLIWRTSDILNIQSFKLLNGIVNIENTAQYAGSTFWVDNYFDRCVYGCFFLTKTSNYVS
jgi:hypothetical protein